MFRLMRMVAVITMCLAWVLYGIMPVMGAMPAVAAKPSAEMAMTHVMPMPEHGDIASATVMHDDNPCPHRDGMAHSAFCAGCVVLPAAIVIHDGRGVVHSYPPPPLAAELRTIAPSPLAPPPRA